MGKLAFASTINDLDPHQPQGRSACFDYGSWYGCNCDCPVFLRGECKCEDIESSVIMIEEDEDLCEDTYDEIYKMYPQLKEYRDNHYKK